MYAAFLTRVSAVIPFALILASLLGDKKSIIFSAISSALSLKFDFFFLLLVSVSLLSVCFLVSFTSLAFSVGFVFT